MKCPFCGHTEDRVVDSRSAKEGAAIRRRRECIRCERRFTTYEYIEDADLTVVKKDGRREPYNRENILRGIRIACGKRPVGAKEMEEMTDKIESNIHAQLGREISSSSIGQMVMDELHKIDQVAYVRFASVYREFKDSEQFIDELNQLLGHDSHRKNNPGERGANDGTEDHG